jgi:hypothetical protein
VALVVESCGAAGYQPGTKLVGEPLKKPVPRPRYQTRSVALCGLARSVERALVSFTVDDAVTTGSGCRDGGSDRPVGPVTS